MAGLALSYSEGAGAYTHPETADGALESELTQLAPYGRFTLRVVGTSIAPLRGCGPRWRGT